MDKTKTVEECLRVLERIKVDNEIKEYISLLNRIERYVKGKITSFTLLWGLSDHEKRVVCNALNKIINYQERDIHYYVPIPEDKFYKTCRRKCILAGSARSIHIEYNDMETVGPVKEKERFDGFVDRNFAEITGDFSIIPEGTMLDRSDWYKIIGKCPYIHSRMYMLEKEDYDIANRRSDMTFLELAAETEATIKERSSPKEKNDSYGEEEEVQRLPQHVIDSIEFVIPEIYLPFELVKNRKFGTFEDILNGKYIRRRESEKTIIGVLQQRFRGVSAVAKSQMAFLEKEKDLMLAKLRNENAKLLGYVNYADQLARGNKSPQIEIDKEKQTRIDKITSAIEEIERNWDERTNR